MYGKYLCMAFPCPFSGVVSHAMKNIVVYPCFSFVKVARAEEAVYNFCLSESSLGLQGIGKIN
jgi:hypothetical protein